MKEYLPDWIPEYLDGKAWTIQEWMNRDNNSNEDFFRNMEKWFYGKHDEPFNKKS